MGQASSKAARKATANAAVQPRRYPPRAPAAPSQRTGEPEQAATAAAEASFDEEYQQKDTASVDLAEQLTRAITGRHVDIHDRQGTAHRRNYAERDADLQGRITLHDLRSILVADKQARAEGGTLDISAVANRHHLNEHLLEVTLKHLEWPETYVVEANEPRGL